MRPQAQQDLAQQPRRAAHSACGGGCSGFRHSSSFSQPRNAASEAEHCCPLCRYPLPAGHVREGLRLLSCWRSSLAAAVVQPCRVARCVGWVGARGVARPSAGLQLFRFTPLPPTADEGSRPGGRETVTRQRWQLLVNACRCMPVHATVPRCMPVHAELPNTSWRPHPASCLR